MTVSIRSVLHNTQFKRADPVVEVEGKDLDMPVRWVFTNEREDVSSFLSGGEMLIIEGNALLAADWHGTLGQYVASLAQAGVAALVVELVEGVGRMPDELVSAARLHGLTLIGLKSRVPFVDICQSVVVPEFLRTLVFARPRGDDQFADCTFSPSLDMSR